MKTINNTNTVAGLRRHAHTTRFVMDREAGLAGTLRPAERELRKRNVVAALVDGAETLAEAVWHASTNVGWVKIWAEMDDFFARAIETAVEDGRDLYEERDDAEAMRALREEELALV